MPTVLAVDDSQPVRDLLERVLTPAGYTVTCAKDGGEALATVRTAHPDIILIDIKLPTMDGYAVCRTLKSNPSTATIPVLMLTGMDETDDIRKALRYGADGYIMKPFRVEDLRGKIQELLELAKTDKLPDRFYLKKLQAGDAEPPDDDPLS